MNPALLELQRKIIEHSGGFPPLWGRDKKDSLPVARQLVDLASNCKDLGAPLLGVHAIQSCYQCFFQTDELQAVLERFGRLLTDTINDHAQPLLARIAACQMLLNNLWLFYMGVPERKLRREIEAVRRSILTEYVDAKNGRSILITGFLLRTNFVDRFELIQTSYQLTSGYSSHGPESAILSIGSVFQSLINDAAFQEADALARAHPDAFVYPWERAWACVASGHVAVSAVDMRQAFLEAARGFAQDTEPPPEGLAKRSGGWMSINIEVWAPYYFGRAALIGATIEPDNALAHIREAHAHLKKFVDGSGWHVPVVTKTALTVQGVLNFLESGNPAALISTIEAIGKEVSFWGEDQHDPVVIAALTKLRDALLETERDRRYAFVSGLIIDALNLLDSAPIASPAVALRAASQPMKDAAWQKLQETAAERRVQAIKIIEAINDESAFRKLLKELLQGLSSVHTKITHGPIEHGRDLIVVLTEGSTKCIWMIQAKVGRIERRTLRELKDQIEAMFSTRLDDPHIPDEAILPKKGFVMHTDIITSHIDPEFLGWLEAQQKDHGWSIELWGPDRLVEWLIANELHGILRSFAERHGIRLA
jgi:hypothetical protein